ncbi:Alpha/Beta hydrolase protein [Cyathus striatus]|nr:Alpha/Beta hydrolase protein [Cyathus striatus]
MSIPQTTVHTLTLPTNSQIEIFYRAAGPKDAPTLLLLHGFPTSSFQFRNLITKLAGEYRVIAPDLPGFGFTKAPPRTEFQYTFDNLGKAIIDFTHALNLTKFAIYVFDYGAPVGFRLALARPDAITGIISQNGNAFEEGLGKIWDVFRPAWAEPGNKEKRESLRFLTTFELTKSQYTGGETHPDSIPPETYHLDQALLDRPGNVEIQLDLFVDYRNNVTKYPSFQAYLAKYRPPVLAVWGKNDVFFIPAGAEAFKSILEDAEVFLIDGGHFILEGHLEEVGKIIQEFLKRRVRG